jgi:uncharacterized protein (DUF2147 family)
MTRLFCFAAIMGLAMGLSTAAHAETFFFTVGGHHISISAARNCYSAACVSVSIPGIVATHRKHGDDVVTAQVAARPAPKASAAIAPAPVAAAAPAPQIAPAAPPMETRAAIAPPASPPSPPFAPKLAASDSKEVAPPPLPPAEPVRIAATDWRAEPSPAAQPITDNPPVEQTPQTPPVTPPPVARPAPDQAPVLKAAKVIDAARDDSPVGDWQTEGKAGAVRIEACGKALCGYLINPSSQAKAESILINMKPKRDTEWRGSIFSRASGNTYNATMTLRAANLLRVEACALGHFFCSGNDWTRIVREPAALVTSRDEGSEPRS